MAVQWLPEALDDVDRLFNFLFEKNPPAAERMTDTLINGTRQLEQFPDSGRPMNDSLGLRELFVPFGGSHYVLRYRLIGSDATIIRVWHHMEVRS
jgi:plasmid stabilization system protein ParE